MKEYKRDVSYKLMRNIDGHVDFCVSAYHSKQDGMNLYFSDGVLATFGGLSFPTSKSAWWHWYKYLEAHPEEKGKPQVVMYEV